MPKLGLLIAAGGSSDLPALFLALAVLIASAKILGDLTVRIGQPAILGELMAGLLLGPTFLDVLNLPPMAAEGVGETVHQLGQLGVLWLMFAAGLEMELSDLRRAGAPAALGGVFGVAVPFGLGAGTALAFALPLETAIFVGTTLSATSVSISAQTLLELGRLRTREGMALLGAAVIDDILVILSLSIFISLVGGSGTVVGIGLQIARMAGVLLVVGFLSLTVLPRLVAWSARIQASEGLLALTLVGVLTLAWAAEDLGGVAAITGAFLAGVGLARSHFREEIEAGIHRLGYGFFVPLFLVDMGLQSDLGDLTGTGALFAVALILVALVSKVLGSGLGSRIGGFDAGASFRMGLGMISRGEVGLIVAAVGVAEGILPPELFTVIVLVVLATTLATPPLLRWAFAREGESPSAG